MIRIYVLVNGRTRFERRIHRSMLRATLDLIRLQLVKLTSREHFAVLAQGEGNVTRILWRC